MFPSDNTYVPFVCSWYYDTTMHSMATISINKAGNYNIGHGISVNPTDSSVSVWGK